MVEGMVVSSESECGFSAPARAQGALRPAARPGGRSFGRRAGRRRVTRPRRRARAAPSRRPRRPGRSAAWIGCDLARVDAQLGAEAMAARPGQVGQQARLVVELRRDAGDRGAAGRDARGDGEPAGGIARGRRRLSRCPGRGRARSRACRRPGGRRRRPRPPRCTARHAARAFDQREHAARGQRGPHRGDLLGRLGLGQHHAVDAGFAQQPQVVGERMRDAASLMRTTMRARSARVGRRGPVRDRVARLGLGVGGDGVLQVQHDRVGAAGQRLGEALGPVARARTGRSAGAAISDRLRRRAARGSPSRVDAELGAGSRRCARRARAPGPCAGLRPRCRAAACAGTGPPASRPRASGRAPSAAGAPTPRASC